MKSFRKRGTFRRDMVFELSQYATGRSTLCEAARARIPSYSRCPLTARRTLTYLKISSPLSLVCDRLRTILQTSRRHARPARVLIRTNTRLRHCRFFSFTLRRPSRIQCASVGTPLKADWVFTTVVPTNGLYCFLTIAIPMTRTI